MNAAWRGFGEPVGEQRDGAEEVGQVRHVRKCRLGPTGAGATTQPRFVNGGARKQDHWRRSHCWCLGLCPFPPAGRAFLHGLPAHSASRHENRSPGFTWHTGSLV